MTAMSITSPICRTANTPAPGSSARTGSTRWGWRPPDNVEELYDVLVAFRDQGPQRQRRAGRDPLLRARLGRGAAAADALGCAFDRGGCLSPVLRQGRPRGASLRPGGLSRRSGQYRAMVRGRPDRPRGLHPRLLGARLSAGREPGRHDARLARFHLGLQRGAGRQGRRLQLHPLPAAEIGLGRAHRGKPPHPDEAPTAGRSPIPTTIRSRPSSTSTTGSRKKGRCSPTSASRARPGT